LITNGKFNGDVVLIIGDDLELDTIVKNDFIILNNIIVKKFKNISFPLEISTKMESLTEVNKNKKFQWHKVHVFDVFFKNWDYVFYLDCGMRIHNDISKILNVRKKNFFIAQSDDYPGSGWDLSMQFVKTDPLFNILNQKYSLNIDYPQTTLMLFDTNIIDNNLINNLIDLTCEYPITRTNEQAIIALYFTNINKIWEVIPEGDEEIYYYSYNRIYNNKDYIITKWK
jgi:hypothetical protein